MATPYTRWTAEESQILTTHYHSTGAAQLARTLLPNRTPMQISSRAAYVGLSFDPSLIGRHARNTEDLSHLIKVRTPFAAYMLGFLWADGTVSKRTYHVELKIVDEDFADIRERWLLTTQRWRYRCYKDGHPRHKSQAIVGLSHQPFHAFLVQCGYLFKTGDSAADVLAAIPVEYHHYWWRGYFDGDGGVTASGRTRRICITSCYNQDWSFFKTLAQELGLAYRVSRGVCKGSSYSTVVMENEANIRRFMDYIYQGEQFGLTRKRQAYLDYLEYKRTVRPNKTSRYRGVCWNGGKRKWMMQIYHGRHLRQYCSSELEAAQAYDAKARELFGNKAVLNFPNAA